LISHELKLRVIEKSAILLAIRGSLLDPMTVRFVIIHGPDGGSIRNVMIEDVLERTWMVGSYDDPLPRAKYFQSLKCSLLCSQRHSDLKFFS